MDIQRIIAELEAERGRLEQAISALRGSAKSNGRKSGQSLAPHAGNGVHRRRRMSAASKKRISEMMKLRWAERKKAKTNKAA